MSGKTYRETDVTLKSILSKHDTLDGNRLSLEGFLSYYREVAAGDPRQARIAYPGTMYALLFSWKAWRLAAPRHESAGWGRGRRLFSLRAVVYASAGAPGNYLVGWSGCSSWVVNSPPDGFCLPLPPPR